MSVTRRDPNTIFLGGERTEINDRACSEAIMPGQLVELFNSAGVIRFRKHATAGGATAPIVATEMVMLGKGISDASAAGDLIECSHLHRGATAWMWIASGQDITAGEQLESAGDGTLRVLASGTPLFTAEENKENVTVLTRIRVSTI